MIRLAPALLVLWLFNPTPMLAACVGDCGSDGEVGVEDLLVGVHLALGLPGPGGCEGLDANSNGRVEVAELLQATNNAVSECGSGPTPTPLPRPTVPPDCKKSNGYTRVVFSEAAGTNTLINIDVPLDLFGVSGATVAVTRGIGGASVTCPTTLSSPIVTLEFSVGGFPQDLAVGNTYPLHNGPVIELPLIKIAQVDYAEVLAANPFGRQAWRSDSGTLTVDALDGDTAQVHFDAHMVPIGGPAQGTFDLQVVTIIDKLMHN